MANTNKVILTSELISMAETKLESCIYSAFGRECHYAVTEAKLDNADYSLCIKFIVPLGFGEKEFVWHFNQGLLRKEILNSTEDR